MAQEIKSVNPQEEIQEGDEDRIGTLKNVLQQGEMTVGEPEDVVPPQMRQKQGNDRMVVVRINESIEDMSYVAGGRRQSYTFEQGKQYRVPIEIARELERNGKVWH